MRIPLLEWISGRHAGSKLPRCGAEIERLVQLLNIHGVTLVMDVGANVGQYGLQLRQSGYRKRIVSVEPGRHAHSLLERTADADPLWHIAPRMALGVRHGFLQLRTYDRSDMNSILEVNETTKRAFPKLRSTGSDDIEVNRLDRVMGDIVDSFDHKSIFLKVDTQGYERHVLEGAEGVASDIVGLQVEMSLVPLYDEESDYLGLFRYIHSLGFTPRLVVPGFFSRVLARQLQVDVVFFRE